MEEGLRENVLKFAVRRAKEKQLDSIFIKLEKKYRGQNIKGKKFLPINKILQKPLEEKREIILNLIDKAKEVNPKEYNKIKLQAEKKLRQNKNLTESEGTGLLLILIGFVIMMLSILFCEILPIVTLIGVLGGCVVMIVGTNFVNQPNYKSKSTYSNYLEDDKRAKYLQSPDTPPVIFKSENNNINPNKDCIDLGHLGIVYKHDFESGLDPEYSDWDVEYYGGTIDEFISFWKPKLERNRQYIINTILYTFLREPELYYRENDSVQLHLNKDDVKPYLKKGTRLNILNLFQKVEPRFNFLKLYNSIKNKGSIWCDWGVKEGCVVGVDDDDIYFCGASITFTPELEVGDTHNF